MDIKLSFLDNKYFNNGQLQDTNVKSLDDAQNATSQAKNEANLERLKGSVYYFMGGGVALFIANLALEILPNIFYDPILLSPLGLIPPFQWVASLVLVGGTALAVTYYFFNKCVAPLIEKAGPHFERATALDEMAKKAEKLFVAS
jgi:hypothetical protein